jgi:NifU-like protein involved in Fe-S cluster formation
MDAVNSLLNPFGYGERIWHLFNEAPYAGSFPANVPNVVSASASTPAAKAALCLQASLRSGEVADARFRAYGCPTTIAVGAWIANWMIGRRVEELPRLEAATLRAELEIPDDRAHCALVGEDALKALFSAIRETSI